MMADDPVFMVTFLPYDLHRCKRQFKATLSTILEPNKRDTNDLRAIIGSGEWKVTIEPIEKRKK
jgi:hypothetical protein